jgi:hypothetical protein
VIPHRDIKSYYDEYLIFCDSILIPKDSMASYSTFVRAFNKFRKDVSNEYELRLLRCKGSFNTCEVCNNAAELLRKDKKYDGIRLLLLSLIILLS